MFPTHLARFAQALALSAILAALVMPAVALGASGSPDWFERYVAAHPYGVGASLATPSTPATNWLARNDHAHFGRSDAFARTVAVTDGRTPDTRDAAGAPTPVVVAQPGAFDWGDAGIGAGFASGLIALLATTGLLLMRRHARPQIQPI